MSERYLNSTLGRRNMNAPNHWEELNLGEVKITKPTVICLPGNGSISERAANGFCKIPENMLGVNMRKNGEIIETLYDKIDIIGFSYGMDSETAYGERNTIGNLSKEEIDAFVDSAIMPLCCDENNVPFSQETLMKNLSLITFFSHCHGARECFNITANIYEKLYALGVSSEVAINALSQMTQFSYAPSTKDRFVPTISVSSARDSNEKLEVLTFMSDTNEYRKAFAQRDNGSVERITEEDRATLGGESSMIEYSQNANKTICMAHNARTFENGNNAESLRIFVYSFSNAPYKKGEDEHDIVFVEKDENWNLINTAVNFNGKSYPILDTAEDVSQMISYSVARSVATSMENAESETFTPKPTLSELMQENTSIMNNPIMNVNAEVTQEQ